MCLPKTSLLTLVESNAQMEALAQHDLFNSELVLRAEFDSAQGLSFSFSWLFPLGVDFLLLAL